MPVFEHPTGLVEVAHFTIPQVRTWGNGEKETAFKEQIRRMSGLSPQNTMGFEWFVFCIRCIVGRSRDKEHQAPDVDNILKLVVDAFTGLLCPEDNLHHVRGVQAEAEWGPDEEERTEVWIYGWPGAT